MQFMVEMGRSSSGRGAERPVAKLLAEKMYKEVEPKRRSLSGIARLIRLERLPSLWHVHREKKRLSDSYGQNNTLIKIESNRQLYDGPSNRRSPMKQREFNDVYGDLEASDFVNRRFSSRWSASSMLTKSEMVLIQQKLDAKHFSCDETTDENLQDSKDLNDTLHMLDSKGLLMKSGRKPDSSFANHSHHQRVNPSSSLRSRRPVLKPLNSTKYEGNAKSWIPDRDATGRYDITSHLKCSDGVLLEPHNRHRARISHKISDAQLEEKNKKNILPTPIVVLRPNLGNMQNAALCGLSPYCLHDYVPNLRKMKDYPCVGGAQELSWRRKDSYYNAESPKPVTAEAKKLAREITQRIRAACDESEDAKYSGFREYVVDESLYNAHRSDFNCEPEMLKWSPRNCFVDDNERDRYPSSESINGEGKNRLSERWNISHRYQDLEIVGKGSTVGEMLDITDGKTRSKNYADKHIDRSTTRLGINDGSYIGGGSLGITSKGGSKDEIQRTSSTLRSLPPIGGRIHRRGTCHDVLAEEEHLIYSDPISCGRSKVAKGYPSHGDFLSYQGSRSRSKKPFHCPPIYIKEMDSSLEVCFEIQMEANVKDLSEQHLMFQMAEKDDCSGGPVSDIVSAEHGITTLPSKSSLLHPKHSSVDNKSSAAYDQEDFCIQGLHHGPAEEGSPSLQYLGVEPVFSESSKDADHASPVSVLEVPFVEDASSSSESFERVGPELNELRMQLQLLKMEFGAYDEISTLIPIERDIVHSSSRAESWEVSYTLDVLMHSGLQAFDFDMFRIMWHSPDCPLAPTLFNNLEKKYSDEISGLRSERRLLFDRINSALLEIFQKHVDLRPWVMPKLAGLLSTWQKQRARDVLEKLIDQESANGQITERILDRVMQWADSTEEIALLGNKIEKLLIDDMITEFLCD